MLSLLGNQERKKKRISLLFLMILDLFRVSANELIIFMDWKFTLPIEKWSGILLLYTNKKHLYAIMHGKLF